MSCVFRSGPSSFARFTTRCYRRGPPWTELISAPTFIAVWSLLVPMKELGRKSGCVSSPGQPPFHTRWRVSKTLHTSHRSAEEPWLVCVDTSVNTYTRRTGGEDVAEGVQDMHAPHGGGGEFPKTEVICSHICQMSRFDAAYGEKQTEGELQTVRVKAAFPNMSVFMCLYCCANFG